MGCLLQTLPSRVRGLCRRRGGKIVRVRGSGWLQGNSIIKAQNRYTYHFSHITETVAACTRPAEVQTPILTKKLFVIDIYSERKITLLQWSVVGYRNHIPGQTPCQRVADQTQNSFQVFVRFLFCFLIGLFSLVSLAFAFHVLFCFETHAHSLVGGGENLGRFAVVGRIWSKYSAGKGLNKRIKLLKGWWHEVVRETYYERWGRMIWRKK